MTIDQLALLTWQKARGVHPTGPLSRQCIIHAREAAERMIRWFYPARR